METNDGNTDPRTAESILPTIASDYDLIAPVTCDLRASGLNDVFEVTAGGGGSFYLKVYRAGWRTREQVLEEVAALQHLARKGVRIAHPIARRDGAFVWTCELEGCARQAVLFAGANGMILDSSDESVCRRTGRALAKMHHATDDFTGAPVGYDLGPLILQPLRALEPLIEERPHDRDFLRDLVGRLRHRIERLPGGALDRGYCHGDFRPANLAWDEASNAVTIFDFELGGTGFRAYDLAYWLMNVHPMAVELLWGDPSTTPLEPRWSAFLEGYTDIRPLRAADREVLPVFAAMRPIRLMGNFLQTARRNIHLEAWPPTVAGGLPTSDLFERVIRFLRSWDDAYLKDH